MVQETVLPVGVDRPLGYLEPWEEVGLRRVRRSAGFTIAELARRSGISEGWLTQCELNRAPEWDPPIDLLRQLAEVLGEAIWATYGYETIGELRDRAPWLWGYVQRDVA